MTTTINIRIDSATKTKAQKIIEDMGLDLSSAVKLFINKVIMTKSIPFELKTGGVMNDPKYITRIKKETAWAEKYGKRYSSSEEMVRDILRK